MPRRKWGRWVLLPVAGPWAGSMWCPPGREPFPPAIFSFLPSVFLLWSGNGLGEGGIAVQ